jgi:glycosyltransferase involved in cell wall biosynthesis
MADHTRLMQTNTQGVSVVMNVYNGARFLADAVESVLGQTRRDLELIVVDDGSTDGSLSILQQYAGRDSRLRILEQRHAGVPAAANAGIRAARFDWIARTDSDDRMLPHRLDRQLAFVREHPELDVACSYCYFINAAGKRIGSSTSQIDMERGLRDKRPSLFVELAQSTVLMRKSAILRVGGYREDLPYAEDRDLWGRLATTGHAIGCQQEFLEEFRLHGGSMTMHRAAMQHEVCSLIDFNIVRRLRGEREYAAEEFREWQRRQPLTTRLRQGLAFRALHAFKRASRHYGEGRYCKCALTLAAAVSMNPAHIVRRVASKLHSGVARA